MDILDRIILLLQGREQRELTEYLGLKNVAFSEWKSGKSKSYRKYLIEIADFFDVSLDYLVYGKESPNVISDDVKELLSYYNSLSDIDRGKLIGKAETLAELAAERAAQESKTVAKEDKNAVERFKLTDDPQEIEKHGIMYFDYPASAGTGLFLDETIAEKISVRATPQAYNADFAIPVSGDSMEPEYSSGDIVLIESSPNVPMGKVGIFVLDGEVYIKEYGGDCLISYNEKYPPIMLKKFEAAICLGRVLGKAEIVK